MDTVKTGKFIAELRKEKGLTQEELGQKLGVTNKTVSRWETGNYLPPAEVLILLSELYDVSINELLSGRKLPREEYIPTAEENLRQTIRSSSFSLKDRTEFWKKKWLREHAAGMVFIGIGILGVFLAGVVTNCAIAGGAAPVLLLAAHCWRHNAMMTYVEQNAFDGTGS